LIKRSIEEAFEIEFPGGNRAQAIRISKMADIKQALRKLGLNRHSVCLVVVGGADELSGNDGQRLRKLFNEALAKIAQASGASVVEGAPTLG
jgi:hypothetical protein